MSRGDAVSPAGASWILRVPLWVLWGVAKAVRVLSLTTREATGALRGVAVDLVGVEGCLPHGPCGCCGVLWPTHCPWDRSPVFRSQSDCFLDMKPGIIDHSLNPSHPHL